MTAMTLSGSSSSSCGFLGTGARGAAVLIALGASEEKQRTRRCRGCGRPEVKTGLHLRHHDAEPHEAKRMLACSP